MHTYIHTYVRTYVRTYIHTYIHTYVRTYVHICIHTYACRYNNFFLLWMRGPKCTSKMYGPWPDFLPLDLPLARHSAKRQFNMFISISRLFLRWMGPKSIEPNWIRVHDRIWAPLHPPLVPSSLLFLISNNPFLLSTK